MFEKEYITQKILLFIAMIFILGFAYNHYLSEKNGISFQEGENFTIANSSENSDDNPYHTNVYNTEEIQENFFDTPCILSLINSFQLLNEIEKNPNHNSVLATSTSENNQQIWLNDTYYTNLLSVSNGNTFQYKQVTKNCILSQKAPLYYYILHTISSFLDGFHLHRLGFFINAIFLFLSSYLLLGIAKRYLHASWAGLAGSFLFALSIGCLSTLLCSTPYIMLLFFILFITEMHLSALRRNSIPIFLLEAMGIINILALLTDYSYLLFFCTIGICLLITLLFMKRFKDCLLYLLQCILSLLITSLIYPAFVLHIGTIFFTQKTNVNAMFQVPFLQQNCSSNLTIIANQLFTHTKMLVVLFMLLLIVLASCLKKGSFREHLSIFTERLRTGDLTDLFIGGVLVLSFFTLSTIYQDENYFILITLLPFITLMLSYLCYRLLNAAIHSEYNSGIFSIVIALTFCFLNLFTTPLDYTYSTYIEQTTLAAAHQKDYCIFLASDNFQTSDHILELQQYAHSLILKKEDIKSLKKNTAFLSQTRMIVYVTDEDYINSTIDKIAKIGQFNLVDELTNYRDANENRIYVYQLRQMKSNDLEE